MKRVLLLLPLLVAGTALAATEIVATLDAPDTNISGLGYGNGSLWAVDGVTEYAYRVNSSTGAVEDSWYCTNGTRVPTGLTFAGGKVYIAAGTPPNITGSYCYIYNDSGIYQSSFSLDC